MKKYTVAYRMSGCESEEKVIMAASKAEAWAAIAMEPVDGEYPYSAWVVSVEYSNGRVQYFATSEGNAY